VFHEVLDYEIAANFFKTTRRAQHRNLSGGVAGCVSGDL
jgi:hypothetical protein